MAVAVKHNGSSSRVVVGSPLRLHADRFFDSDPAIRRVARELYDETRDLPLVCPHGHVDPSILANNSAFPEPTALLIIPDHYIFRMLHSQGVRLEDLGVPTRDGSAVEGDPRVIWQRVADSWYLFRGTPSGAWLAHELHDVFGVRVRLDGDTAQRIYDEISEKLLSPEFRPRALFEQFRIEMLATTDAAVDPLQHHQTIRTSDWSYGRNRVVPCFRPDTLFRIAQPAWSNEVSALALVSGRSITSCAELVSALAERRRYFASLGATAADHGVLEPYTCELAPEQAERLFQRATNGDATAADQREFEGHMLMEMARLSVEDGLVMQVHPGSSRDHNQAVFDRFGSDKGADIPIATEYTRNLRPLLNRFGDDPRFSMVLFTLDESTYSRELAPLAGHYPALRLGPPWWFHDSIEGIRRYREQVSETAGIYNTAGFNDDTRAFCSIPARHDLARRMDANWIGGLVARHIVEMDDARDMARALAVELARETYRFPEVAR
ncbi:MAG: glucuronate isomerase [bacterium]